MVKISEFVVALLNEHSDLIISKVAEFKQSQHQEVSHFDFFMMKQIMFKLMREEMPSFDRSHANIVMEKTEGVRLLFFRDANKNSVNSFFQENMSGFKSAISKNKSIIEVIGDNSANIDAFVKFVDSFLLGYRDYANIKKILHLKTSPTKEFFMKIM